MHTARITSIIPEHVHRNPLPKIGFKAIHPHIQQSFQLIRIPPAGIRIGKVHQPHTCLPVVRLPHPFAVRSFHQIALRSPFLEKRRSLGNIGIDPHADFQAVVVIPPEHPRRVGENPVVPGKIAPLEFPHPKAVKMEYRERNLPVHHSLNEGTGGLLIIVRGK